MKKHSVVLLAASLAAAMSLSVSAASEASGSGTGEDPFRIETAEQLDSIRENLEASYILAADIDLSGYENWIPIGNMTFSNVDMETGEMDMSVAFSGSFDGNGHTITNLSCSTDQNMVAVGLFGCSVGSVENLTVENFTVEGDETVMASGGVIGYAIAGNASGITMKGKNHITGINCVGGIVGGSMAQVTDCSVENTTVTVIGDNDFSDGKIIQCDVAECGGLIVGGSFAGILDNCTASGLVEATGNEPVGLGGIAGCIQCIDHITGNTADVVIEAGNGHAIGGLCGYAGIGDDGDGVVDDPCVVTDCSVTIDINADGATHVGGLIGTGLYFYGMEDRFSVENCVVTGTIDGAVTPGTVAGRAEGSEIISCTVDVLIDGVEGTEPVGTTECMYESADQYTEV